MEQKLVAIPQEELLRLRKKAEIADDAIVQLQLSLEDLKNGRVKKFLDSS